MFNEITKRAIQESFSKPTQLDTNRVNAQQARRFLDRVVGFEVSPLLWAKIARGLSAGRVQSVAVRLIVEREREIRAFVPEEYWQLHADLQRGDEAPIRFEVVRAQGKAFEPKSQADAALAVSALTDSSFAVSDLEARKTSSRPPARCIRSSLQQAASTRVGVSVKKTMTLAQRLYEAGHITYMRTDSTNLSSESVASCRDYISEHFSGAYLPESPNRYGAREGAQEAHEAIRPSNVILRAEALKDAERDAQRLYELIWRQFVACQMTPARYLSTTVTVGAAGSK